MICIGHNIDLQIHKKRAKNLQEFYKKSEENSIIKDLNNDIREQEAYIKEITSRLKSKRKEFKEYTKFNDIIEQQNELNYLKREVERLRKQKKLMERTVGTQNNELERFEKETEENVVDRVNL